MKCDVSGRDDALARSFRDQGLPHDRDLFRGRAFGGKTGELDLNGLASLKHLADVGKVGGEIECRNLGGTRKADFLAACRRADEAGSFKNLDRFAHRAAANIEGST